MIPAGFLLEKCMTILFMIAIAFFLILEFCSFISNGSKTSARTKRKPERFRELQKTKAPTNSWLKDIWNGQIDIVFDYTNSAGEFNRRTVRMEKIYTNDYGEIYFSGFCFLRYEGRTFAARRVQGDICVKETGEILDVDACFKMILGDSMPQPPAPPESNARQLGKLAESDPSFTLTYLVSLYDENKELRTLAYKEDGRALARIFKNSLRNSFVLGTPEEYRNALLFLESSHNLAKLLRSSNYRYMTYDYLCEEPRFVYTYDYEKNIEFFNELLCIFSGKNKILSRIFIEGFLKRSHERKRMSPHIREINNIEYIKMSKNKDEIWKKNAKPYIELLVGTTLPSHIGYIQTKRLIKIVNNNINKQLFSIGYGKYGFTTINFSREDKYDAHPYGLIGKRASQKIYELIFEER